MDHCKTVIEVLKERLLIVDGEGRHHHRAADVLSTVGNMIDIHVYEYSATLCSACVWFMLRRPQGVDDTDHLVDARARSRTL
jgi:uncharacterized protein with ATP-grasp and redox domains